MILSIVTVAILVVAGATAYRLVRGPSMCDRLVSASTVVCLGCLSLCIYAVDTGQGYLLDLALLYILMDLVGTLAFARYVERGAIG